MMENCDTKADRKGQANQPVEATETPHTVSRMETATCPGASGRRASPDRKTNSHAMIEAYTRLLFVALGRPRPGINPSTR
jgi:hypothetical protein